MKEVSMKKDIRYQRTEKHLADAVLTLGLQKDVSRLTVKEITEFAEINRITFYTHYETIEQLLSRVENLIIEEFINTVAPFSDLIRHPEIYISRVMNFYYSDSRSSVFTNSSRSLSVTKKGIEACIENVISELHITDPELIEKVVFAINGIYGVFIRTKIRDDETVTHLCNFIHSLFDGDFR